jgi:two-component system nitrate/nitrite response regulator NarL
MLGATFLPPGFLSWLLRGDEEALAPARVASHRAPQPPRDHPLRLSLEEQRILRYLMEGQPNKVIADRLGIALATANVHVKAVVRKVGAQNRTQAAIWAKKHAVSHHEPRSPLGLLLTGPETGGIRRTGEK